MKCAFCGSDAHMEARLCGLPILTCHEHVKLTWSESPTACNARVKVLEELEAPARLLEAAKRELFHALEVQGAPTVELAWNLVNSPSPEGGENGSDQESWESGSDDF